MERIFTALWLILSKYGPLSVRRLLKISSYVSQTKGSESRYSEERILILLNLNSGRDRTTPKDVQPALPVSLLTKPWALLEVTLVSHLPDGVGVQI